MYTFKLTISCLGLLGLLLGPVTNAQAQGYAKNATNSYRSSSTIGRIGARISAPFRALKGQSQASTKQTSQTSANRPGLVTRIKSRVRDPKMAATGTAILAGGIGAGYLISAATGNPLGSIMMAAGGIFGLAMIGAGIDKTPNLNEKEPKWVPVSIEPELPGQKWTPALMLDD